MLVFIEGELFVLVFEGGSPRSVEETPQFEGTVGDWPFNLPAKSAVQGACDA